MLSLRRQKVLEAVIREYVSSALPVASRTLVSRYGLGVSSATVRNELSVLEDDGYIIQPHTSAGRIPTDFGYRAFVDDLLASEDFVVDKEMSQTVKALRENARELDELMDRTSRVLTRLTDCLAMVLPPNSLSLHIKHISLVVLHRHRLMMVIVSDSGRVFNRSILVEQEVEPEEALAIEMLLNQLFSGKNFVEMREAVLNDGDELVNNPLGALVLEEMFTCLRENETSHAHRGGLSLLMQQPEFAHSHHLVPVMQALEDDSVPIASVESLQDGEVSVRIGHENDNELLSNVSVVAARYGRGDAAGIIAVIGPTRMPYGRIISAVRSVQQELNDIR